MTTVNIDGVSREMTAEEQAEYNAQQLAWENTGRSSLKLNTIKEIRLQKLKETDYYALQDVTMSNEMKAWRQSLRNIPQDYTTEEEYDLLLARDENGNLTHSVWSKP
jgi:enterochelin esterase-like enzyme